MIDYAKHHKDMKRMIQRDLESDRRYNRRHGIIDNHLCSRCDRIISGNRRACMRCLEYVVDKYFRENFREKMMKDVDKKKNKT